MTKKKKGFKEGGEEGPSKRHSLTTFLGGGFGPTDGPVWWRGGGGLIRKGYMGDNFQQGKVKKKGPVKHAFPKAQFVSKSGS